MSSGELAVRLRGIRKEYHALRPLRIEHFELHQGETVALLGFDRAAAEVLVNLMTGATLPDAGDVEMFGSLTRGITDTDSWFRSLDRFGILSERVVLVEELTVEQNLALPLSFDVDGMAPELRHRVETLAAEVGISPEEARKPLGGADPATRLRLRLGKALALDPWVLLAEHPNASLPADEVPRFAGDLSTIAERRGLGMLVLTADAAFASRVCSRVLTLRPATGEFAVPPRWRRWFLPT